ncbi:MAG: phosphomethylpyrimidine synthase ThiC [Candidatus Paceibacterota bacterium]|jgi:phosphomethylpyrimidine synthase
MLRIKIGNLLSTANVDVGEGLSTKINLIVGANNEKGAELERKKIDAAARLGVHTIIDLSTARIDPPLWVYGRRKYPKIAFGKVAPILVAVENDGDVAPEKLLEEIEWSVKAGVDYMTMNLVPMKLRDFEIAHERNFVTTSRQGGVLLQYMMKHDACNPHGPILEDIFSLFREYNVTLHIGATFRPTSVLEAYDKAHIWELKEQIKVFKRAEAAGVQAIIEPMSHQPLKDIGPGIDSIRKKYGSYIPFQMLGPIVTEYNLDCDQYAAASGAAIAAMHNVGKITTIPPREHKGFPTLRDTIEGIKATVTSVHAGDMCRLPELMEVDRQIADKRKAAKSCNPDSEVSGCDKCSKLCPLLIKKI